jgi:hypothetical protein
MLDEPNLFFIFDVWYERVFEDIPGYPFTLQWWFLISSQTSIAKVKKQTTGKQHKQMRVQGKSVSRLCPRQNSK